MVSQKIRVQGQSIRIVTRQSYGVDLGADIDGDPRVRNLMRVTDDFKGIFEPQRIRNRAIDPRPTTAVQFFEIPAKIRIFVNKEISKHV